jgi:surfactin synthase thioesterase subunit
VPREDIAPWAEWTTGAFSLHMLPGDHFFPQTHELPMLGILARALLTPS